MKSFILLSLLISSLFAHKVNLFITNEKDSLDIYSYFANGAPCKNCKLIIKNDESTVFEGTLDEKGKYSYIPKDEYILVTVDAGGGHLAKEIVKVENIKHENIKEHKEKEKSLEYKKILLGLAILFIIFFLLKRFKK